MESVFGFEPLVSIGLMARDSLGGGARFGFAMLHNEQTLNARTELSYGFGWWSRYAELESRILRDSTGDPRPVPPNAWVQLERSGNELLGYYSENGSEWVLVAAQTLDPSPPETLFVGVGCTFHCDGTPLCVGEVEVKMCEVKLERAVEPGRFRRGDVDSNARVNLTDAVFLVNHLFLGGPGPACDDAADANDDGKLDLADAVVIANHLFKGGPALPHPGIEACGEDGEVDGLKECGDKGCE